MKASSLSLLTLFSLASQIAGASHVSLRSEANIDDLDEWLAAAQRVSPEALRPCPIACSGAKDSAGWFLFPDAEKLSMCNETMLLGMVVQTEPTGEDADQTVLRACSADYDSEVKASFSPDDEKASLCTTANRVLEEASIQIHYQRVGSNDDSMYSVDHLLSAGRQIANHLALQKPSCTNNVMQFAYSQSSAVGLFAGAELHQHGVTFDVLEKMLEYAQANSISQTTVIQLCGVNGRGADYSMGIVATGSGNLGFVKEAVKTWAKGDCVSQTGAGEDWMAVTIRVPGVTGPSQGNGTTTNHTISAHLAARAHSMHGARGHLSIRADCKTTTVIQNDGCYNVAQRCGITQANLEKYNRANLCTTLIKDEKVCCSSGTLPSTLPGGNSDGTCKTRAVVSGDTCSTLASKCGISLADFMKANTKTDLCGPSLAEGYQVCCSSGKRPTFKPSQKADGSCATYRTQKDDNCAKIAAARDLTTTDLLNFNKQTWGWNGCELFPDFNMCVSTGSPPMPAPVANAVCGPTMPNTPAPAPGTNLTMLNPCPLNVCCNVWGQCGMTDDFCVLKKSAIGAPGTSALKNGCVSNCGRDIIKGPAPEKKIKIAYYESWNFNRPCLNMWVNQIDTSEYTHIHFAFANVTRDYRVDISDPAALEQFEIFKTMKDVKKIISFGGWAFSTEPATFNILREAVLPANRETFKNNLIKFMNDHELDGIDLDWEYPGAPDISGIPKDDPENGLNYYKLLSSLKTSVGSSKSVSFAAPASYWYLKSFPIGKMAKDLDYIVYMTYDLHGQWDYGNKWTSPGCPNGNCLRSHVNETETKDALSMVTKAGAPSNKVVVGVASYGSAGVSHAAKGRCTETAGYISNAEIEEILQSGLVNRKYTTEGSNIIVWNNTEWVAYMDDDMKKARSAFYDTYNFAGTTDWAVDLQEFKDGSGGFGDDDDDEPYSDPNFWPACNNKYKSLEQLEWASFNLNLFAPHCIEKYLAEVEIAVYETALKDYKKMLDDGYDNKFKTYEKYMRAMVPEQINYFMASEKVDKYFHCKERKFVQCCENCPTCFGCTLGKSCKTGYAILDMDECPKWEFEGNGKGNAVPPNATFTLTDPKGFWTEMMEEYGIDETWVNFQKRLINYNSACAGVQKPEELEPCMAKNNQYFYDYPMPSGNIQIANPKAMFGDSYDTAEDTLRRFKIVADIAQWDSEADMADIVDAMSLSSFSVKEAIGSMQKVVEKANELEAKERKETILMFLTAFLFFIPLVGEVAGAMGMVATRAAILLAGGAGELAMTVYDVVDNPEGALLSVFSYVAGAGIGRTGFRNAAVKRRGMDSKLLDGLGPVKMSLDKISGIRQGFCKLRN